MTIKKGDFIEIDYTGAEKDEGTVFDTTILSVAEEAGLIHKHEPGHDHDHSDQFSSLIICVGEKHVLPALDDALVGSTLGEHKVVLGATSAFGKKDAKLLTTFSMSFFKQQKLQPYPGMQLTFDNDRMGVVRSVGAGRVMVDFNHPLAGRDIVYDVKIKRIITDQKEKLEGLLKILRFPMKSVDIKDGKAVLVYEVEIPEKYLEMLKEDIKRTLGIETELVLEKNQKSQSEKTADKKADSSVKNKASTSKKPKESKEQKESDEPKEPIKETEPENELK